MEIHTILIVGTGAMGKGIAQFLAESGAEVYLYDASPIQLEKALAEITSRWEKRVKKNEIGPADREKLTQRIHLVDEPSKLPAITMLVEAVPEKMELKKEVLDTFSQIVAADTIIATNTSSLSVSEIATRVKHPERFLGLHFFNPVPIMPLVEIVASPHTAQAVIEQATRFLQKAGKETVIVNESPGFVVNRLLIPMVNEACFLLQEGVARATEIDKAMKLGSGLVIGPLALGDFIGLDVCLDIMENYYHEFAEAKYRPCPLLRKMVRAGYLGRKTGRGFFSYD